MGRYLIGLFFFLASAWAQKPGSIGQLPAIFTVSHTCTASGTACVWTIQQPSADAKNVSFLEMSVYCSAACSFTQERNGTAAAGNAITPAKVNPDSTIAATFTAHHSSGSTGGTSIGGTVNVIAGITQPVGLTGVYLIGDGTTKNFTVRTNSFTGTAILVVKLEQY